MANTRRINEGTLFPSHSSGSGPAVGLRVRDGDTVAAIQSDQRISCNDAK